MKLICNILYFFLATLVVFIFTLLYLPLAVFVFAPYLKAKKNISFKEFWGAGSNIYISIVSTICPFIFLGWPTFRMIKKNAKKESKKDKIEYIDIEKIKKGDIVLTGKESWSYSQPIQLSNILSSGIENRYWTHACIYIGDGKVIEAQAGDKGVIETDLNDNYIKKSYKIKILRHKFLPERIINGIIDYCRKEEEKNTSYDKWGVSFYVLASTIPPMFSGWLDNDFADKFFNVKDAYFCSELVADAFKKQKWPLFGMKSWRVKPLDFALNPFFEEVIVSEK